MDQEHQRRLPYEINNAYNTRVMPYNTNTNRKVLKKGKETQSIEEAAKSVSSSYLESFNAILEEKKKQFQMLHKIKQRINNIEEKEFEVEEENESLWGWFIDPSDLYRYTFQ